MVLCPKCGKPARIGYKILKDEKGKNKKYRECKKCKQTID